jgi:uncharacterized protein with HEPN domain
MIDNRERLLDILEAIGQIEKYATREEEVFPLDELIQTWMLRNIQVTGEAARAFSLGFEGNLG